MADHRPKIVKRSDGNGYDIVFENEYGRKDVAATLVTEAEAEAWVDGWCYADPDDRDGWQRQTQDEWSRSG